jgi:hypothetical protein
MAIIVDGIPLHISSATDRLWMGLPQMGPPYPRYIQRRRAQRAAAVGGSASFDHYSWGWGGDFVWMMLSIWMIWAVAALFWR